MARFSSPPSSISGDPLRAPSAPVSFQPTYRCRKAEGPAPFLGWFFLMCSFVALLRRGPAFLMSLKPKEMEAEEMLALARELEKRAVLLEARRFFERGMAGLEK